MTTLIFTLYIFTDPRLLMIKTVVIFVVFSVSLQWNIRVNEKKERRRGMIIYYSYLVVSLTPFFVFWSFLWVGKKRGPCLPQWRRWIVLRYILYSNKDLRQEKVIGQIKEYDYSITEDSIEILRRYIYHSV